MAESMKAPVHAQQNKNLLPVVIAVIVAMPLTFFIQYVSFGALREALQRQVPLGLDEIVAIIAPAGGALLAAVIVFIAVQFVRRRAPHNADQTEQYVYPAGQH